MKNIIYVLGLLIVHMWFVCFFFVNYVYSVYDLIFFRLYVSL